MSNQTSTKSLTEAAQTCQLASNAYLSHLRSCPCGHSEPVKPEVEHLLGSLDALRNEVQRLGVTNSEARRELPLRMDIVLDPVGNGNTINLLTSLDSGKTWSNATHLNGYFSNGNELLSPHKTVLHLFTAHTNSYIYYRTWDNTQEHGWAHLPGSPSTSYPISVAMSEDGSMDVFYVHGNRQILHRAWTGRGREEAKHWSPAWTVVGDEPLSDFQPVAISRGISLIDLFMVSGSDLYWKSWVELQWTPQKGFEKIGENCEGIPAVVARHRGRIDVFILSKDGELLYKTWKSTGWEPADTEFVNLGGEFSSTPTVVRRTDERLDVFIIGKDGKLYQRALGGSTWHPTSGFHCLGGNFEKNIRPTVTTSREGLDIFLVGGSGTDGAVYHKKWDGYGTPSSLDFKRLGYWNCRKPLVAVVREQDSTPSPNGNWFYV